MSARPVRLERTGPVATLTLDRARTRNALDAASVEELRRLIGLVSDDADLRVLVLAGDGPCFSAGADLRAMQAMGTADSSSNLADTRRFVDMLHRLRSLPLPTVARVHGAVIAGGVGLVACCDIVVAAETAFFRLSEVRLGLVPAMVGPYLVEAIGPRTTRRLMLTAERFDARQALAWGLVHEVAAAAELDHAVDATVARLLRGAPGAQAVCKELVGDFANHPLDAALRERTAQALAARRTSREARAGVEAFFRRSQPYWAEGPEEQEPRT